MAIELVCVCGGGGGGGGGGGRGILWTKYIGPVLM